MKLNNSTAVMAFLCLLCVPFSSFAAKPQPSVQATNLMQQNKALLFEENKGQLIDSTPYPRPEHSGGTAPNTDIKYYGHSNGVYLYCKPGKISFVFTKTEKEPGQISEATGTSIAQSALSPAGGGRGWKGETEREREQKTTTSRMDLVLIGSNPSATITATDQQEYYENFYTTGDADHGITNVHTYKTVTYKNIYPNIDMILSAKGQGMEYSFLVHPGGNVNDIQLRWNGTEKAEALKDGGFKYASSLGNMEESAPKSFTDGKEVLSSFIKKGYNSSFKVGNYDKGKDLVIDPSLVWATYYGGDNGDDAFGVATDVSGNVFITGWSSSSGMATSGAYQTSGGVGYDAFLAKFSSSGSLAWATYFGGYNNDNEYGGIATDPFGNVYITGEAPKTNTGIATSGAYQTSITGLENAFLAKFSSSGSLTWGTYYGGSGGNSEERAYGLATDVSGNAYISGITTSTSRIATSGAYQTSISGSGDNFLAKFSSSGSLAWATYYGGSSNEPNGVATDGSGNVYIVGNTISSSGIATSGAYQTSYEVNSSYNGDGFLAKFNSGGTVQWATYYADGSSFPSSIATDGSGNVYITGGTVSSSGIATSVAIS